MLGPTRYFYAIPFCVVLFRLVCLAQLHADIELRLTGNPGSNSISYSASGSIIVPVTSVVPLTNATGFLLPTGGIWDSGFSDQLGDFLQDDGRLENLLNLSLSDGISLEIANQDRGSFDEISLFTLGGPTIDGVGFADAGIIQYPQLVSDTEISWQGNGTFVLTGPWTFDTLFVNHGEFSEPVDGGVFRLTVVAVPEPSAGLIFTAIGLCCLAAVNRSVVKRLGRARS